MTILALLLIYVALLTADTYALIHATREDTARDRAWASMWSGVPGYGIWFWYKSRRRTK